MKAKVVRVKRIEDSEKEEPVFKNKLEALDKESIEYIKIKTEGINWLEKGDRVELEIVGSQGKLEE